MTGPWLPAEVVKERAGWDYIAISLGDKKSHRCLGSQVPGGWSLKSPLQTIGEGFSEAEITMPDGTPLEITE